MNHHHPRRIAVLLRLLVAATALACLASPARAQPDAARAAPDAARPGGGPEPDAARAAFRRPAAPAPAPIAAAQAARIGTGHALFLDPGLSAEGTTSCATCHRPRAAWSDGRARAPGRDGAPLPRHTPTLLDLAWAPALTWDGRMEGLERQATDPILNPRIGGMTAATLPARVRGRLDRDPAFAAGYVAAFGDREVTMARVATALAAFERTLVSPPAPFDRWIEGEEAAIGPEARRGFALFTGRARCAACHSGWRLTDDGFHDVGLPDADPGRGAVVPGEPTLQHAFKTPTLRDVARRAPYMHDGSLPTLEAVLSHYDGGFTRRPSLDPDVHALDLSAAERADLVAFLQTLTSPDLDP